MDWKSVRVLATELQKYLEQYLAREHIISTITIDSEIYKADRKSIDAGWRNGILACTCALRIEFGQQYSHCAGKEAWESLGLGSLSSQQEKTIEEARVTLELAEQVLRSYEAMSDPPPGAPSE